MDSSSLLTLLLVLVSAVILYPVWLATAARRTPRASTRGSRVSLLMLLAIVASQATVLDPRSNADLLTEGLSPRNMIQIALAGVMAAWATILCLNRIVPFGSLFAGGYFWCSILIIVNGASAAWSVWPQLTLFRATELAAGYVVAVHLFSSPEWLSNLRVVLTSSLCIYIVQPFIVAVIGGGGAGSIHAVDFHSNSGAFCGALLLLLLLSELRMRQASRWWTWLLLTFSLGSVVLMGSLGSWVAALIGVFCLLSGSTRFWGLISSTAVIVVMSLGAQAWNIGDNVIAQALIKDMSDVSGRDTQVVENFTGRLPLWNDILTATADEPFGTGFVAGERTFSANREQEQGNWGAMSAHNGYLSAWVGTGWLGVVLVSFIYFAAFRRARDLRSSERGLLLTCIVVVDAINNLTFPGIGSALGIPWLAIFAVFGANRSLERKSLRVSSQLGLARPGRSPLATPVSRATALGHRG